MGQLHGRPTEEGLYYYGTRSYDPLLGRFISPDSIVPDPADPRTLNRYSYVLNNPLRYEDPTGHYPIEATFIECRAEDYIKAGETASYLGEFTGLAKKRPLPDDAAPVILAFAGEWLSFESQVSDGNVSGKNEPVLATSPVNGVEPEGTSVWFLSLGGMAFISDSPGSKSGHAVSRSVGIAFDTDRMQPQIYGSIGASQRGQDVVVGLGASVGVNVGVLKGNMNDFMGLATERTTTVLVVSKTQIETQSGKQGLAFSIGGKGIGFGYVTMDTYAFPLNYKPPTAK